MLSKNSDKDWHKFGQKDPYYWVTTFDQYRDEAFCAERRKEFFAEAETYARKLLSIIRRHVDPSFRPGRMLDFGCGVGRVAVPFSGLAAEVVGADISQSMLAEARRNSDCFGCTNLSWVRSDDQLSEIQGTFDFIHSIWVFQHIHFRRGLKIFQGLLERLDGGGVLSFHFLISNTLSRRRKLAHWLKVHIPLMKNLFNLCQGRKWSDPMMQLHNYDLNAIIDLLKAGGCDQFYLRYTRDGQHNGVIVVAQKKSTKNSGFVDLGEIP